MKGLSGWAAFSSSNRDSACSGERRKSAQAWWAAAVPVGSASSATTAPISASSVARSAGGASRAPPRFGAIDQPASARCRLGGRRRHREQATLPLEDSAILDPERQRRRCQRQQDRPETDARGTRRVGPQPPPCARERRRRGRRQRRFAPQSREVVRQQRSVREPSRRIDGEAAIEQDLEARWHRRIEPPRPRRTPAARLERRLRRAGVAEWQRPGHDPVQQHSQGEQVGARVVAVPAQLLGRHEGERAAQRTWSVAARTGAAARRGLVAACDPEIDQHRFAVVPNHDVGGLQVAMDDAARMGVGDGPRHRLDHLDAA
jgi:hypothetical protein